MIDRLLACRLVAVMGKGGAGRTTISAALATLSARRGRRTLLIEADLRGPIAAGYGKTSGFNQIELEPNLFAMTLGGQESLEEYLGLVVPRPVLRLVFASTLYQYFVHAAPALRELTMMGKIFHEIERRAAPLAPWDLVVFDAPASGQALRMIRTPLAARETFGDSVIGGEARNIARLLGDRSRSAIVAVTTAEPLVMAETLELRQALSALKLEIAAVFLNRVSTGAFAAGDIALMMRRGAKVTALKHLDALGEIARAGLRRRSHERRARAILQRQSKCSVVTVDELKGRSGRDLAEQIAARLEHSDASRQTEPIDGSA